MQGAARLGIGGQQRLHQGGAAAGQAEDEQRLFDHLPGDAGKALAVLDDLQPVVQTVGDGALHLGVTLGGDAGLRGDRGQQHGQGLLELVAAEVVEAGHGLGCLDDAGGVQVRHIVTTGRSLDATKPRT